MPYKKWNETHNYKKHR